MPVQIHLDPPSLQLRSGVRNFMIPTCAKMATSVMSSHTALQMHERVAQRNTSVSHCNTHKLTSPPTHRKEILFLSFIAERLRSGSSHVTWHQTAMMHTYPVGMSESAPNISVYSQRICQEEELSLEEEHSSESEMKNSSRAAIRSARSLMDLETALSLRSLVATEINGDSAR